jgi:hypothetical protein
MDNTSALEDTIQVQGSPIHNYCLCTGTLQASFSGVISSESLSHFLVHRQCAAAREHWRF